MKVDPTQVAAALRAGFAKSLNVGDVFERARRLARRKQLSKAVQAEIGRRFDGGAATRGDVVRFLEDER